jgi:hypothetical protein
LIIEEYFRRLSDIINASPLMDFTRISFDKRGAHVGFIRGELTFIDGSTLHIREYVDVEVSVERFMYAYQYMDREGGLFFRYDNTGHHRSLNLPTYPHHKHERNEEHVIASQAPSLEDVLAEVLTYVRLP